MSWEGLCCFTTSSDTCIWRCCLDTKKSPKGPRPWSSTDVKAHDCITGLFGCKCWPVITNAFGWAEFTMSKIFSNYSKVDWKGGCDMVQCITWCMELSRLSRLEDTDLLIDDDRSEHSIRWEMKWDLVCTSVFRSLRSARMRARTGKAVIDSATPRNTVKAPMLWSEPTLRILHMMYDTIAPRPNGSIMPAAAIHTVMTPDLPREFPEKLGRDENGVDEYLQIFSMFNSNPTRKRKKMSPTSAIVSSTVKELSGKMFLVKPGMLPKAVGPNNMPPRISAQVMQTAYDEHSQRQLRRMYATGMQEECQKARQADNDRDLNDEKQE